MWHRNVLPISGIIAILLLSGCLGGSVFSDHTQSGPALKQPPVKPSSFNNTTSVNYIKKFETIRVYNETAKGFRGSNQKKVSISPSVRAKLLAHSSSGYFVETVSSVSTHSSEGGSQLVGDSGVPDTSIYFVSNNRMTRIATPSPYPSNQTNLVAIANFDSHEYKITSNIISNKSNSSVARNQSIVKPNASTSVGNVSASKTPALVKLTVGQKRLSTKLPRTQSRESLWKPIGIVIIISPDHKVITHRFYSSAL